MSTNEQDVSFWLKVGGTVVAGIIVAMMSWMTMTLQDVSVRMAVLESQVSSVAEQTRNGLTRADLLALENRISRNEERYVDISRRIAELENGLRQSNANN